MISIGPAGFNHAPKSKSTLYIRRLFKDGKLYTVTYDEYHIVDTIESEGKFLASTHKVVKQILKSADGILLGGVPKGFVAAC